MTSKPIRGPRPLTDAWHKMRTYDPERTERPVVIGSSEAAAAVGLSPYTTPFELWCRKTGAAAPVEENAAMRAGKYLEPAVLGWFADQQGLKLQVDVPMLFSADHNCVASTPDAITADGDPVDAKTTTFRRFAANDDASGELFGAEGTDHVPPDVLIQCQQHLLVAGGVQCWVPVLFDARHLRVYRVEANADLQARMIQAEQEMAERVINDDPPEPNWEHSATRKLISNLYGEHRTGEWVDLGHEAEAWYSQMEAAKAAVKDATKAKDVAYNHILHLLSDSAGGVLPDGTRVKIVSVAGSTYTVDRKPYERLSFTKPRKGKL